MARKMKRSLAKELRNVMQQPNESSSDTQQSLNVRMLRSGVREAKEELCALAQLAAQSSSASSSIIALACDDAFEVVAQFGSEEIGDEEFQPYFERVFESNGGVGPSDSTTQNASPSQKKFVTGAPIATNDGTNVGVVCVFNAEPPQKQTNATLNALRSIALLAREAMRKRSLAQKGETAFAILQKAQKLSRIAHFVFDPVTFKTISISKSLGVFYDGDGNTERQLDFAKFVERLHPEDAKRAQSAIGDGVKNGAAIDIKFRVETHKGVFRNIWLNAEPLEFNDDRSAPWIGIMQDVTDQVLKEQALKENIAFRRAATETALDCVITIDAKRQYQGV